MFTALAAAVGATALTWPSPASAAGTQNPAGIIPARTSVVCGGAVTAVPFRWTAATSNCGFFGYPGIQKGYRWWTAPGINASICVQGAGYDSHRKRQWYNLGCGKSGSGTVPWGNVAAPGALRVKNSVISFPIVSWRG